jgi:hypothetical protein
MVVFRDCLRLRLKNLEDRNQGVVRFAGVMQVSDVFVRRALEYRRQFDPLDPFHDSPEGLEHFLAMLLTGLIVVRADVDAAAFEVLRECRKPFACTSWMAGCRLIDGAKSFYVALLRRPTPTLEPHVCLLWG